MKTYTGLFRSQAEDAFRGDAAEAAAHGWQPIAQHWNGTELVVTYAQAPAAPPVQPAPVQPAPVQPAPAQGVPAPVATRDIPTWLVIGVVLALIGIGGLTGLAVTGQGPFASGPGVVPLANVRPYVPEPTGAAFIPPDPTLRPTARARAAGKHERIGDRAWAQVLKDPDGRTGKRYRVWACISQFDAATGNDTFRGMAANTKLGRHDWFLEGNNALFTGPQSRLARFVEDDVVGLDVTVLGAFSYDTQIGGNTTVPLFEVDSITRAGSC